MIITSELVNAVTSAFNRLEKKEIIPLATPMSLQVDRVHINQEVHFEKNHNYSETEWLKICVLYALAILMALYRFKCEMKKMEDVIMCGWNMSFTMFAFLIARHLNKEYVAVNSFINQLLDFERRYIFRKDTENNARVRIVGKRMMHYLIKGMTTNIVYNANLCAITAVMQPGAPGNVVPAGIYKDVDVIASVSSGTNLMEEGIECAKKALSFVFSYTLWRHVSRMGILHSVIIVPTGSFMLYSAILELKWNVKDVDFLSFTRPYREIQLLSKLYNNLFADTILRWNIIAMPTTLSICLYVVISNGQSMAMDALSQFISLGVIMLFTNILVFGRPVSVYTTSSGMKRSMCVGNMIKFLNRGNRFQARLAARTWTSISELKICFFGSNFFDETTPLVLLDLRNQSQYWLRNQSRTFEKLDKHKLQF